MSALGVLRRVAIGVLALAALALVGQAALRASAALDRRLEETRYVVRRAHCPLVEWQRGRFEEQCPLGTWAGDT